MGTIMAIILSAIVAILAVWTLTHCVWLTVALICVSPIGIIGALVTCAPKRQVKP